MPYKPGLTFQQRYWLKLLRQHGPAFIREAIKPKNPERGYCCLEMKTKTLNLLKVRTATLTALVEAGFIKLRQVTKPCIGRKAYIVHSRCREEGI